MYRIKVYRYGSDPEFMFGKVVDFTTYTTPASSIITNNRAKGLTTFIGTDGHPATAELRPAPSYNIKRHLYDMAVAIDAIDKYLKERAKEKGLTLLAQPYVGAEPLGGHIHVSFFIESELMKRAQAANLSYGPDGMFEALDRNVQVGEMPRADLLRLEEDVIKGEVPTAHVFNKTMNYLLFPFESFVQPWGHRTRRMGRYGGRNDVRTMAGTRPKDMPMFDKWAYSHYEYRTPSTWLVHPMLAYAYFALAKLVMLNFTRVATLAKEDKQDLHTLLMSGTPSLEVARDHFNARYKLVSDGARLTPDVKDLPMALVGCESQRSEWWRPDTGVNIEAWRSLIG